jgi:hypothetical protein
MEEPDAAETTSATSAPSSSPKIRNMNSAMGAASKRAAIARRGQS